VYATCHKLFGPPSSHGLQLDEYYDTPDGQLKKQDLVIRIRSHGKKKTVALKSPRIELPSGITNRIELEFLAAEGEKVHEQLVYQGVNSNESIEKERWTFVYKDFEIVMDKLPFIGSFIEIEGPSEAAIHEIVELLNLSSCQIVRKNYGELLKEKFNNLLLPLSTMCATFAKEKELSMMREKRCT